MNRFFSVRVFLLLLLWQSVTAYGRDWVVTTGGLPIAEVLAGAAAGDRLLIEPGHYRVNLRIDKPVEIAGSPGAILDGGGVGDVLRIEASDVAVRGLRLQRSGDDLTKMNAVIFVESGAKRVQIENNEIHAEGFGIWLDGTADARVIGNRIQGNAALRSQDRGNGIHLFNTTGALVEGNEVWETRDGIYIDTSNHNVLQRNHMHHLRYGIHYMYSYHNEVVDNRTSHTRTGYALMQSKFLTVTGNRSEQDQNYGVLMNYIVSSTIANNRIIGVRPGTGYMGGGEAVPGAEGKAVFIYNSQFNAIHGNRFADSDIGIHLTAGSEDNKIYNNAFVRNRTQVKYVATRHQEWSYEKRGNYWSDYLGYDVNSDGVGELPYEPNDAIDRVLWKYPLAKMLMHSPAVETLHWVQRQFPVLRPPGVRDSFPLIRPVPQARDAS